MKLEFRSARRTHLLLGLAGLVLAPIAGAQGPRLNAPFAPDAIGRVRAFALSPTEARAVYAADQDTLGFVELYNAPTDGTAPGFKLAMPAIPPFGPAIDLRVSQDGDLLFVRTDDLYRVPMDGSGPAILLSGTMVTGGGVATWIIGATRAVYVADALVDEVFELFSVPLDGSAAPTKLSGTLVAGGDVFNDFVLSPDGTRVLYRAMQNTFGAYEIYSVPLDGSAASVRLNAPLPAGRSASFGSTDSPFSADSSRIAYIANQDAVGVYELYSVSADGSAAPVKLNSALVGARDVTHFAVSPSGRVAYRADQDEDEDFELYSVPLDGSAAPLKLNGALVTGGDVSFDFRLDAAGQRVVYRANELLVNRTELFSVPLDGSAARVKLNGTLLTGGIGTFEIVPSGQRVVYLADQEGSAEQDLHSVPIGGGAAVRLSQVLGADEKLLDFVLAGGRALYRHSTTHVVGSSIFQTHRLFSAPVGGTSAPLELSRSVTGDELELPRFDAPGNRAVYIAHRAWAPFILGSESELFSAPLAGGPDPVKLHPELDRGGTQRDVDAFAHSPDGRWVVYVADQETSGLPELFAVRADGFGAPFKLSAPVSFTGIWTTFSITPDSSRVVYRSLQFGADHIFSVLIDGSAAAVPLTPLNSSFWQISPDSQRVVYQLGGLVYSVPIDGSASPVALLGTLVPGGGLISASQSSPTISPDSARYVFIADKETDEVFELYSVPLDGSAAPTKLSGVLVTGGDARNFRISPDSTRVVFIADKETNETTELYSTPIDGGTEPVKISGTLVQFGDVPPEGTEYRISPDSNWVVYRADQLVNSRFELFSTPIDGSASPLRLNGILPAAGDVEVLQVQGASPFAISPDSTRVVYRADQETNDRFELFAAPIDASTASVKLSGTLIAAGDLYDRHRFEISADGAKVVYLADALVDEVLLLFSAPIDASAGPTTLSGAEGASDFELCPSGTAVVYRSPLAPVELFFARLDGSRSFQACPPLAAGRNIIDYEVSPDSTRVVYRADQAEDDVFELWLRYLERVPRPATGPGTIVTRTP